MDIPRNALDAAAARTWARERGTIQPTWFADFLALPDGVQEVYRSLVTPPLEAAWDHLTTAIQEHQEHTENVKPVLDREALKGSLADAIAEADLMFCTRDFSAWAEGTMGPDDYVDAASDPDVVTALLDSVLEAQDRLATLDGIQSATQEKLAGIPTDGAWTPEESALAGQLRTTDQPTEHYPDNLNTEHHLPAYARNLERALDIWRHLTPAEQETVRAQMNRHAADQLAR